MATPRIRKVMKGRIHEVFGIHRFFRFGGGERSYRSAGFYGFYGVCGYTEPTNPGNSTGFWGYTDTRGFRDTRGPREGLCAFR